jgi:hypothetical protein
MGPDLVPSSIILETREIVDGQNTRASLPQQSSLKRRMTVTILMMCIMKMKRMTTKRTTTTDPFQKKGTLKSGPLRKQNVL